LEFPTKLAMGLRLGHLVSTNPLPLPAVLGLQQLINAPELLAHLLLLSVINKKTATPCGIAAHVIESL